MPGGGINELYGAAILDHHTAPRNRRELAGPSCTVRGHNPLCGDEVTLQLAVDGAGHITEVCFDGSGCAVSLASASMLTEAVRGTTLDQAEDLAQAVRGMVTGAGPVVRNAGSDLEALEGVRYFPVRAKCAMLPWNTLRQAVTALREGRQTAASVIETA